MRVFAPGLCGLCASFLARVTSPSSTSPPISIHPSIHLSIHPYPSIHPSIHPPVRPSARPSAMYHFTCPPSTHNTTRHHHDSPGACACFVDASSLHDIYPFTPPGTTPSCATTRCRLPRHTRRSSRSSRTSTVACTTVWCTSLTTSSRFSPTPSSSVECACVRACVAVVVLAVCCHRHRHRHRWRRRRRRPAGHQLATMHVLSVAAADSCVDAYCSY